MKRGIGKETPQARNLSRREVLGRIGAAAASVVGDATEQSASAEQAGFSGSNEFIKALEAQPFAAAQRQR
jgi:hypothetical protein